MLELKTFLESINASEALEKLEYDSYISSLHEVIFRR